MIHSREPIPCAIRPQKLWDAVSATQKQRLKTRFSSKKTPEENWFIMFEILFPNLPRPRSPCRFSVLVTT